MVGTAKWQDEWVAHIFVCKRTNMSNHDIAKSLREHFPRTKDFNAGGVKYVLGNWQDPTRPSDQVLGGGVKKKKSTKASKPSAGLESALNNALGMGSPAISDASSSGPTTQTHPKVVGSGQTAARLDNPRPMTMLASQNSSTTSPMQSNMASMGYPNVLPGSQAYPNGSFNRQGHLYPVAATADSSIENPYAADDGGRDLAGQNMQRSSTNKQHMNPYKMDSPNLQNYMQQYSYSQLQNGQKHPAMSNQMTSYMNEQTQNVRGGFSNPARVGLGIAGQYSAGGALQNFYTQPYKQTGPQGLAQAFQTSHGLPNTNSSSVYQSFGGNLATGNAGVNHGLPAVSKPVSGNNMYTQSDQPSYHQGMFGAQNNQPMMGNVSGTTGMGRNNTNSTTGSRLFATPKKPSMGQNVQQPSSSKPGRASDEFDFNDAERSFPDHHLLGAMGNSHANSASIPQTESSFQNGGKRKRQEEDPGHIQMSAVAGERSNIDRQTNQPKRQKQDHSSAMMAGGSRGQDQNNQATSRSSMQDAASNGSNDRRTPQQQTMQSQYPLSTSISQSQSRSMQGSQAAAGTLRATKSVDVGSVEQGYNDKALQMLRHHRQNGQVLHGVQSLRQRHDEFLQEVMSVQQNKLTHIQMSCATMYGEQLRKLSATSQTSSGTNSQTSQFQRVGELTEGSRPVGMPNSSISYAEQEEQFRRLQEKVPMGINGGSARAPISQPSQQAVQQTVGNINMNSQSPGQPPRSSTNGAGVPPQATLYINRADVSVSQAARVAGHKFDGPPISQPTPKMNRLATAPSQQSHVSENGAMASTKSYLPEYFNRPRSAPQQIQSNGNGAKDMQNGAGYLPHPNMGRPNSMSSFTALQTNTNPAGLSTMKVATPQLASVPMQKSTSLPYPNTRPSLNPSESASMQLSQTQQGQGHSMNRGVQAYNGQQAPLDISRAGTPSSTNGPYQSLYLSSAESRSRTTATPQPMHDQSLHQAVNSAVTGGPSAPAQITRTKTPSPGSKSGTGLEQTSSPPTVSPSTGSEGAIGGIQIINGVPVDLGNVNMVEVAAPIFHQHFTFPTEREGWKVMLNHIDEKYTLVQGNNIIILFAPQFMGGVTWPNMSNQAAASSGSKTTAPKPRRKAPAKKVSAASSATTNSTNATAALTRPSPHPRTSTTTALAPPHPPLWPGQKVPPNWGTPVPPPPHPPLRPEEKPPVTVSTTNTSTSQPTAPVNVQKKPDLHLDLKDVSPKTSMRKAGTVENQTESGFPDLFDSDCDDDDLFGDGEVFYQGNDNDQVSDPSASANSGDQTSKSLSGSTLPNPAAPSSSTVPSLAVPSSSVLHSLAVPSSSPQATVEDTQQEGEKQSFLDQAQPTSRKSLAPKSILSDPANTQLSSNADQSSSEARPRQVHFEDPKPVEEDILTSENQEEWRARHPIYKPPNPFANAEKKRPPPKPTPKSKKVEDPVPWEKLSNLEQNWALRRQANWLQDVFPDFPSLERLDLAGEGPKSKKAADFAYYMMFEHVSEEAKYGHLDTPGACQFCDWVEEFAGTSRCERADGRISSMRENEKHIQEGRTLPVLHVVDGPRGGFHRQQEGRIFSVLQ
ncbi:hypothetical protein DL98DRAFT_624308 [Cadophora sp. DSE1049]|nr:hypothetical protein DL98DRAFT_624308 [Cadophora sp. DSE1049]